ncbi:taurine catabolism dioxygenase [Panaeolus papilionaceus]|nr:taurine catabolism dioxygenase [Panaeolus papilionaceus]
MYSNRFLRSLSHFKHYDATPHVGTIFPDSNVQLSRLLSSADSDNYIKDLAVLVAHRGVVFFKNQDLNIEQQRQLANRLGLLSGKPASSGLHRHPLTPDGTELGDDVLTISSAKKVSDRVLRASGRWHTDVTYEPVPSDYAILKMVTAPTTGGDTLWASAYEAYDRLSPAYRKFLEGLTAEHAAPDFHEWARQAGFNISAGPRGAPLNVGTNLSAIHPVIRTHPVTGYKALFVNKVFTRKIMELTPDESDEVLAFLARHVAENHDFQMRYKWDKNDIAIWDNRCTFHTPTLDYEELRIGHRVVSLGEVPYFDPNSKSRREDMNAEKCNQ